MAAKQPSQRQLRVGEEIRHALARVLLEGDLRDPVLQEVSITITEVRVSPDLSNATAFVMPLGGGSEEEREVLAALKRASAFLRGKVAGALRLRYTPRLGFEIDKSFAEAQRIESLLRSERVRRDVEAEAGAGDEAAEDDSDKDGS
jgi:ribosome-binding factor A